MGKTKGYFITFDGPNGVGKSRVLHDVANQLEHYGFDVLKTKEPTSSPIGLFTKNGEAAYSGKTLAYLVMADRSFHLEHEIVPALVEGKMVLCDRYVESSLVLQRLDDLDMSFIWSLNKDVYVPDLSVILLAQPEVLRERLAQRHRLSRFETYASREQEVRYYREAARFLADKGFNIMLQENDTRPIEQTIDQIVQKILSL